MECPGAKRRLGWCAGVGWLHRLHTAGIAEDDELLKRSPRGLMELPLSSIMIEIRNQITPSLRMWRGTLLAVRLVDVCVLIVRKGLPDNVVPAALPFHSKSLYVHSDAWSVFNVEIYFCFRLDAHPVELLEEALLWCRTNPFILAWHPKGKCLSSRNRGIFQPRLPIKVLDRWEDFYLGLRAQSPRKPVREALQWLGSIMLHQWGMQWGVHRP